MRGRPLLAEPEVGGRIIDRIATISRMYGTHVACQDGIGVIKL